MRDYLGRSLRSFNTNKLRGLLAEVEFRAHLASMGFADRVAGGGWICRVDGAGSFVTYNAVLFPATVQPGEEYASGRIMPDPDLGLHTIAATFHQSGIHAYYCAPEVGRKNDAASLRWQATQLGLPSRQPYAPIDAAFAQFRRRTRRYNYLVGRTDTTAIPSAAVPLEFSKEHLRISFSTTFMSEMSDVDGLFWGQQYTYPLEIKEKTAASDPKTGPYFGLDLGPFAKLAFYAAKRGNLHSLFIVREIDDVISRNLLNWWVIPFERLAQSASWIPRGGGRNMLGGASTVVPIPKAAFEPLDAASLASL